MRGNRWKKEDEDRGKERREIGGGLGGCELTLQVEEDDKGVQGDARTRRGLLELFIGIL